MNTRGPLPQPDSKRGVAGTNGAASEFIQEHVPVPEWFRDAFPLAKDYKRACAEFQQIIDRQHAAGVGTREADSDLYGQYLMLLRDFREAKNADDRQKARRVMTDIEGKLCIGEYSRQRVGIRGKKQAAKGKLALMLARKNGTDGLPAE